MNERKKYFIWSLIVGFAILPASIYLFSFGVFGDEEHSDDEQVITIDEMRNDVSEINESKDEDKDKDKSAEISEQDEESVDSEASDKKESEKESKVEKMRREMNEKMTTAKKRMENNEKDDDKEKDDLKVEIKVAPKKVIDNEVDKVDFIAKTKAKARARVQKVEYYLDDGKTDDDTYLGSAKKIKEESGEDSAERETEWKLTVDPKKRIPNGRYEVYAKIKDNNGQEIETEREELEVKKETSENEQEMIAKGKKVKDDDYDGDGVSNEEEKRLGTNPYLADSDEDGYTDGDEIKNGYDPLKASDGNKSDKVTFQTPKTNGKVNEEYKITEVKMEKNEKEKKIKFAGKALPNTFIRLFIYSEKPIIVTVKTDADGNWSYELDKELDNGQHEVYVAVTDNTGKITSKSKPLAFVKTAEAVSVTPIADSKTTEAPTKKFTMENIAYLAIIIIASLALAMVLIKMLMNRKDNVEG